MKEKLPVDLQAVYSKVDDGNLLSAVDAGYGFWIFDGHKFDALSLSGRLDWGIPSVAHLEIEADPVKARVHFDEDIWVNYSMGFSVQFQAGVPLSTKFILTDSTDLNTSGVCHQPIGMRAKCQPHFFHKSVFMKGETPVIVEIGYQLVGTMKAKMSAGYNASFAVSENIKIPNFALEITADGVLATNDKLEDVSPELVNEPFLHFTQCDSDITGTATVC